MRLDVDLLLPEQYRAPARADTPERRLVLAIFERMVDDLKTPYVSDLTGNYAKKRRCRVREEAIEWFSVDDTSWPFSFVNCCTHLGLTPEAVRERVLGKPPPEVKIRTAYRGASNMKCRTWDSWLARKDRGREAG